MENTDQINNQCPRILLTGATGYVGGRLLKALEKERISLTCLARHPQMLKAKVKETTKVITGDLLDINSLRIALKDIDVAYYLVHSMGNEKDFQEQDRLAAQNFAEVAQEMGVKRIIYLGGLGNKASGLSAHLLSRQEVGEILSSYKVPVIELRASIVIGSGSLSFEMIRTITEHLPIMIAPRWVSTLAQPIAIEDLIDYLKEAMTLQINSSRVYQIGGKSRASYGDIMLEYAKQRKLERYIIPVPFLTPYLSSLWLGLVTPLYARVGRKLIQSLPNETIVEESSALKDFSVKPKSIKEAITRALINEDCEYAQTRWSDAISSAGEKKSWGGVKFGSRIVDSRVIYINRPKEDAFRPIRKIGGKSGWYYANFLWRIRGFIDLLVGGVGLRRGRRDPENPTVGETIDFWRVEAFEPNHLLRLVAEMKLPGKAWLEFEVKEEKNISCIRQTAIFDPVGLLGLLYWYLLFPLHQFIFAGMLRNIAAAAQNEPIKTVNPVNSNKLIKI